MSNKLNDFRRRIEVIVENMYPYISDKCWEIYRYPEKPFVVKVEDANAKRWVLFDLREILTDDDIKERIGVINQKPEGEEICTLAFCNQWQNAERKYRKLRRQRDTLYHCIKDQAQHWRQYHGSSKNYSTAYYVCEEIRKELNVRP